MFYYQVKSQKYKSKVKDKPKIKDQRLKAKKHKLNRKSDLLYEQGFKEKR